MGRRGIFFILIFFFLVNRWEPRYLKNSRSWNLAIIQSKTKEGAAFIWLSSRRQLKIDREPAIERGARGQAGGLLPWGLKAFFLQSLRGYYVILMLLIHSNSLFTFHVHLYNLSIIIITIMLLLLLLFLLLCLGPNLGLVRAGEQGSALPHSPSQLIPFSNDPVSQTEAGLAFLSPLNQL